MSSLHDPFDLMENGKTMDNVIPFLSPAKIDQMVNHALAHPQKNPRKAFSMGRVWWSGGLATAACIILLLTIFPPSSFIQKAPESTAAQIASITQSSEKQRLSQDDINEFSELVMLDTWERY